MLLHWWCSGSFIFTHSWSIWALVTGVTLLEEPELPSFLHAVKPEKYYGVLLMREKGLETRWYYKGLYWCSCLLFYHACLSETFCIDIGRTTRLFILLRWRFSSWWGQRKVASECWQVSTNASAEVLMDFSYWPQRNCNLMPGRIFHFLVCMSLKIEGTWIERHATTCSLGRKCQWNSLAMKMFDNCTSRIKKQNKSPIQTQSIDDLKVTPNDSWVG